MQRLDGFDQTLTPGTRAGHRDMWDALAEYGSGEAFVLDEQSLLFPQMLVVAARVRVTRDEVESVAILVVVEWKSSAG
jgi:hypothetical protein